MIITFKQFIADYKKYYNTDYVEIKTELDAEEIILDLYNTDQFEFDYANKTIEIN